MTAPIINLEKAKLSIINGKTEKKAAGEYTPIDLSMPLRTEGQKNKLENIFGWAVKTILRKDLDIHDLENADPRRKDFERILDVTFGNAATSSEIHPEERELLLSMYYDMWKNIWKSQEKYPDVKKLIENSVKAKGTPVFRFVPSWAVDTSDPEEYLKMNAGKIWECDCSYKALEKSIEKGREGWLFVADVPAGDCPPISIINSLATLVQTKTAWTEDKLVEALGRYHLTTPAMIKVDPDKVMAFSRA